MANGNDKDYNVIYFCLILPVDIYHNIEVT